MSSDRGVTVTTKDGALLASEAGTWVTVTANVGVRLVVARAALDPVPRSAAFPFAPPWKKDATHVVRVMTE